MKWNFLLPTFANWPPTPVASRAVAPHDVSCKCLRFQSCLKSTLDENNRSGDLIVGAIRGTNASWISGTFAWRMLHRCMDLSSEKSAPPVFLHDALSTCNDVTVAAHILRSYPAIGKRLGSNWKTNGIMQRYWHILRFIVCCA